MTWSKPITTVFFAITIVALMFTYKYHTKIAEAPQSVHAWRQADCASQALNYSKPGASFFKPEILCLLSEHNTSGYCMEEFPIIYYFVGILHRTFGHIDLLFRLTILSSFLIGLYSLLHLYRKLIADNFWSYGLTILLFTAPVIVFYANNYLLNIPALSATIIAWLLFFLFIKNKKELYLVASIILLTFAALLKISELISLCTLCGILFLDYFKIIRFNETGSLFTRPYQLAAYIALSFAAVFAWYYYSHWYNNHYGQTYYYYTTGDMFSMTAESRRQVKIMVEEYWSYYYHNRIVLYLYGATLLMNALFIRKTNKLLMAISIIMLIGSISFVILFFGFLHDHDYYIISLYLLTIFSSATLFEMAIRNWPQITNSMYIKIIFISLLVYSAVYARKQMKARYYGWENSEYLGSLADVYTVKPYLDTIGMPEDAKVVSIPDYTPNLTLYLIHRKGWTNYITSDNRNLIKIGMKNGADYLLISNPNLLIDTTITPYLTNKIGQHGTVSVFKLGDN